MGVDAPSGYGPLLLSDEYWKPTCTSGRLMGTTSDGMP